MPVPSITVLSAHTSRRRPIIAAHDQVEPDGERTAHESFSAGRRRGYVEIPSYLERLDAHVPGDDPPIVIAGPPGAGKSALVACWTARYRRNHPDDFLLLHHVGASAASTDRHAILRRIMAAIRERYELDDPIPVEPSEIEGAFPLWLGRVQRERFVIVIDALDQLDGPGAASWLPEYVPPGVRLILSAAESPILDDLRARDWPELRVEPLTLEERRSIVSGFLGGISTAFTPEQIRGVARDTASANPLFLRIRLEELRRLGGGDALNERIGDYLAAGDLDDLYRRVLERLEADHGREMVRDVMLLIAASRRGLGRRELAELTGIEGDRLDGLLADLGYHLLHRDGLHAFFHDYLRRAVAARYGPDAGSLAAVRLHLRIAGYFARQPVSPRRVEEEPWQLLRASAWRLLHECLAQIPIFRLLTAGGDSYTLLSYWVAIGDRYDMAEAYRASLGRCETEVGPGAELAEAYASVGRFLVDAGAYRFAEECCRRALELRERLVGTMEHEDADLLDRLASVLYHTGRLGEAIVLARRALEFRERAREANPAIMESLVNVGALLYADGSYDEAEKLFERGLSARPEQEGASPIAGKILNNLGAIRIAQGMLDEASDFLERALEINTLALGEEHPDVASNLVNLAFILGELKQYGAAERHIVRALSISQKALGPSHPQLAVLLTNMGSLRRDMGDLDRAEEPFRRALVIREKHLRPGNIETLYSMIRLGLVLKRKGEITEACRLYASAIDGLRAILGDDHPQVVRIGEVLEEMYALG